MDDLETINRPEAQEGGGSITLFLSVYLLVLAFFILLVSISTVEKVKSRAVMDGLSSAFATIFPPTSRLTNFSSSEGDVLGGQEFQTQVGAVFATVAQVIKVETVQPGRLMRVVLAADSLFFPGEARIRDAQVPLLDRLVASLSGRPPGVRFEIEFVIGSAYVEGKALPIGRTLEMMRASAFVREMLSRGAPPDSLAMGIEPGDPDRITLWFHVRLRSEDSRRWQVQGVKGS